MPAPPAARQSDAARSARSAEDWFRRTTVVRLLRESQLQTIPELTRIYGHSGLYLRPSPEAEPELSGNMLHSVLRLHRADGAFAGDLRCLDGELPLASGSLALVYALHVLETSNDPTALVDEIARVLKPEGIAMFVVLNPWGIAHLRWAFRGLRVPEPATLAQLARAAGLEVSAPRYLGPWWRPHERLPMGRADEGLLPAQLRAAYLLQARRRDAAITPIRRLRTAVPLRPGMNPG